MKDNDIFPPTDEELKARYPEVAAFAERMRYELWANREKGDRAVWRKDKPTDLCFDLAWHHIKLMAALKTNDPSAIIEHAADVANLAMICFDAWYVQNYMGGTWDRNVPGLPK